MPTHPPAESREEVEYAGITETMKEAEGVEREREEEDRQRTNTPASIK